MYMCRVGVARGCCLKTAAEVEIHRDDASTTDRHVFGDSDDITIAMSFLVGAIVGSTLLDAPAPLHLFDPAAYPLARCLDGSPGGLYIDRPNTTVNTSTENWMVVLDGGGLCTHDKDCTERSTTDLGSSRKWSKTFNMDQFSLLSNDPRNPFSGWSRVFVPYCSGDMHTGMRTKATAETFGLYFSGFHIAMASIDYLAAHYGLNRTAGTSLVWSGGSAGGVGVFATVDHVAARLPGVRVLGAPVAGFPPDLNWYHGGGAVVPEEDVRTPAFAGHSKLFNMALAPKCASAMGSDAWRCAVPHIVYPYLRTPMFVIQSLTDVVIMGGFEGVPPHPSALLRPDVWAFINAYGTNATAMLTSTLLHGSKPADGLFAPACLIHTGFTLDGPLLGGDTAVEALWQWVASLNASATAAGSTAHRRMDTCKHGFYPPCGNKCPPLAPAFTDRLEVWAQRREHGERLFT